MKKLIYMLIALFFVNGSMSLCLAPPSLYEQLIHAILNGNDTKLQKLIADGANPNQTDQLGNTPLFIAEDYGLKNSVEILLAAGANPTIKNENGETVLINAIVHGRNAIAELLINAGADPNQTNQYGNTPLIYCSHYGHTDLVKKLLAAGANPNIVNSTGITPLHKASTPEIAKVLLAAGANPTVRSNSDRYAADTTNMPEMKNFIEEKMRISKDLFIGAKMDRIDIMCNALKNGALINMPDENGNTALHLAIMNGNLDAVKYLLQFAPSINFSLKNNKGQTVIDPALGVGTLGAIELIQQATVKK